MDLQEGAPPYAPDSSPPKTADCGVLRDPLYGGLTDFSFAPVTPPSENTMDDILTRIIEKRRDDIREKGFAYGHTIPASRTRPIVPFLPKAGTILEIKRASPSKGLIAPDLDAKATAVAYKKAGTAAISCLTEENFFHGNLIDLQQACEGAGNAVAVLRKDFLLSEEEVEIAYLCGADAVLLIARILPEEMLVRMAEKAFSLGISVLLEVREDSDIEKAFSALKKAHRMSADDKIVLGINSRDLKTFAIDLLIPLKLKAKIRKLFAEENADCPFPRIISESGVTSPEAADFVGNLGFDGVLIGEAAAKNPEQATKLVKAFTNAAENAACSHDIQDSDTAASGTMQKITGAYSFWKKLAIKLAEKDEKPLLKICGITRKEDALLAQELGADIIGFIFAEKSKRTNRAEDKEKIKGIRDALQAGAALSGRAMPLMVGVIVDSESKVGKAAIELCEQGILDGIQFHGIPEKAQGKLGYAAIPVADEKDLSKALELFRNGFPRVLIDAKNTNAQNASGDERYGGTGTTLPPELVERARLRGVLWFSGGITPDNVSYLVKRFSPELIDVSSGIESAPGIKDANKMKKLMTEIFYE